jgi:hypothetical protein
MILQVTRLNIDQYLSMSAEQRTVDAALRIVQAVTGAPSGESPSLRTLNVHSLDNSNNMTVFLSDGGCNILD